MSLGFSQASFKQLVLLPFPPSLINNVTFNILQKIQWAKIFIALYFLTVLLLRLITVHENNCFLPAKEYWELGTVKV